MKRITIKCAVLAVCTLSAFAQDTEPVAARKLLEVTVGTRSHGWKSDSNGLIQFGSPPIGFLGAASVSLTTRFEPGLTFDLAALHQVINTSDLPPEVVSAAVAGNISTAATSLRLQDQSFLRGAVYPLRGLRMGYQFSRDSWRYERLQNTERTTIPYIKAIERSHVGFVGYRRKAWRLELEGEGGIGVASVRFLNGIEEYLEDNDGSQIASLTGTVVPLSASVRLPFTDFSQSLGVAPFVRYDYVMTNASGFHVRNHSFSFGVTFFGVHVRSPRGVRTQ
jgi:hypothetical protein